MAANRKQEVEAAQQTLDFDKYDYTVELDTSKGPIRLQFFPDLAPGHVKNFLGLAKIGYYNGLKFHRIIRGFMIQGGCPLGSGTGGPGYTIRAEFNDTPHEAGVLSMARTSDPHSAGSQFFICLGKHTHLDREYTAFGKVLDEESLKTVKTLGDIRTGRDEKPTEEAAIKTVKIVEKKKA